MGSFRRLHIPITAATLLAAAIMGSLGSLAGCQQDQNILSTGAAGATDRADGSQMLATEVAGASNPMLVDCEFQLLFDAAARAVRDHRFTLSREDARLGEIVTEPMTGQQMWEAWRSDAAGLYNQLESSMHTILRTIEVRVYPARDGQGKEIPGKNYLEVRAFTDRLSVAERAFTAANQLPKTYLNGRGLVDALELEQEHAARTHPVFLGRDNLLEDWLIRDILRLTGRMPRRSPVAGPASAPQAGRDW